MFPRIVTLSATNVTMFEYTDMMKKLFEKQAEVEQVSDFWEVGYIYLNIIKYLQIKTFGLASAIRDVFPLSSSSYIELRSIQ